MCQAKSPRKSSPRRKLPGESKWKNRYRCCGKQANGQLSFDCQRAVAMLEFHKVALFLPESCSGFSPVVRVRLPDWGAVFPLVFKPWHLWQETHGQKMQKLHYFHGVNVN